MIFKFFVRVSLICLVALNSFAQSATFLVVGDSISASYGLANEQQGWVALLEKRLQPLGHSVINASISGETTRGGLNRLPALLNQYQPDFMILELGGNDGLQGLAISGIEQRLNSMIELAQAQRVQVVLLGIRIPPNYGPRYTEPFFALFGDLAQRHDLPYHPFILEGIADQPNLMQNDGIHPTAEAQPMILEHVWSVLEPLL